MYFLLIYTDSFLYIMFYAFGFGTIALSIKCLLHQHKKLSLELQELYRKPVAMAHVFNTITGEMQKGGSLKDTGQTI